MGSTLKEFAAADGHHATAQQSRDGDASPSERRASGSGAGDWLVNVAGDVVVPMTTAEIVEGLRAGKLSERSLVWRLGMHDWIVLSDVPQLRLASSSARTSALPPVPARVPGARVEAPTEPLRRNTLPYGFPAARDPASVRQPSSSAGSPLTTAASTPRPAPPVATNEDDDALAVYDRPAASLTFSDSVRAEWNGQSRLVAQSAPPPSVPPSSAPPASVRRLTPVPAVAAPFSQGPRSTLPNSLIPTTSELGPTPSSRPSNHADLSVVLAADFRAAKASTKRVALWAALGSAAVASAFTLWLVRTPSADAPTTNLAAQPVATPPTVAPSVVAPTSTPPNVQLAVSSATSAAAAPPKAPPRLPKAARARPKPAPQLEPAAAAPVTPAAPTREPSDNPYDLGPTSEPVEPRAAAPQSSNNAPSEVKPAPSAPPAATAPAAEPPTTP